MNLESKRSCLSITTLELINTKLKQTGRKHTNLLEFALITEKRASQHQLERPINTSYATGTKRFCLFYLLFNADYLEDY